MHNDTGYFVLLAHDERQPNVERLRVEHDAVTHWLASVQAGAGGGTGLLNQSFLYDEMSNLTERQDNSSLALTENIY